jgi:hypothetical protein
MRRKMIPGLIWSLHKLNRDDIDPSSGRTHWNLDLSAGYLDMPKLGLGAAKARGFAIKPYSLGAELFTFYLPFHTFIHS